MHIIEQQYYYYRSTDVYQSCFQEMNSYYEKLKLEMLQDLTIDLRRGS